MGSKENEAERDEIRPKAVAFCEEDQLDHAHDMVVDLDKSAELNFVDDFGKYCYGWQW